jgi:hypothetical protein
MGKYGGIAFTNFLVDGYNIIAALSDAVTMSQESLSQQTNPFGATSEEHTPLNVEKGVLTVGGGFYDTATNELLSGPLAVRGVRRIVCAGIFGNEIGKHFIGYEGAYDQKYEMVDTKDQLTKANMNFEVSGDVDEGVIVQHLATFTADWDTKTGGANAVDAPVDYAVDLSQSPKGIGSNSVANPTIITMKSEHGSPIPHNLTNGDIIVISGSNSTPTINGSRTVTVLSDTTFSVPVNVTVGGSAGTFVKANSRNGGVGYLQVTAYTGFTGFINRIMHSPDDVTYAALISFTDLGSTHTPAKERLTVAGVVDRYLSNGGDVTGAGSVTAFCGFCRK